MTLEEYFAVLRKSLEAFFRSNRLHSSVCRG